MHANIDVHNKILIAEFTGYGVKCTEKIQSYCANMTFYDKSRYDRIFQQVTLKVEKYAMNCVKRFQNAQDLSVSVGKNHLEYQLMHIFFDNFHQGGKYSAQINSHQEE